MTGNITSSNSQITSRTLALIASPFLLAIALFVTYLRLHNYPLLTKEIVICFIIFGLFCTIIGFAISRVRSWELQTLFSLALFVVFIDSAISLEAKQQLLSFPDNYSPKLLLLSNFIIIIFFIILLLLSLRSHSPKIVF